MLPIKCSFMLSVWLIETLRYSKTCWLSVAMAPANIKYAISAALFANIIWQNTPATTARHGSLTIAWQNNQKAILHSYSSILIWQVSCKSFCLLMHKWLIITFRLVVICIQMTCNICCWSKSEHTVTPKMFEYLSHTCTVCLPLY